MGVNLGRGSVLCPYGVFAILRGKDDHDRKLFPSCQEATADLHLLLHCGQEGIESWLSLPLSPRYPLPPRSSSCTPSSYPSQGLSNAPPGGKSDTEFASVRQGVNYRPQPRGRIFHCLAPIGFPGLCKLRPGPGPLPPQASTHLGD